MSHYVPTVLTIISFTVLILGFQLWRLTSSRGAMVNALFGSMSLLLGAFEASAHVHPEWSIGLPFFASMLFGGRAVGYWWRSSKELELKKPARMLWAATALSLTATAMAYLAT